MKFLIFNILVLTSLGYIIMSKPNENFLQWATNTKEKVSKLTKEEFLEKISNAVNTEKKKLVVNSNKKNESDNTEILKSVKLELLKINKKLDNTLIKFDSNNYHLMKNKIPNDQLDTKIDKEIKLKSKTEKSLIQENQTSKHQKSDFMSRSERSSALAQLITDMELYSIEK